MYYILHGEDDFGRSEELARMRAQVADGDPALTDLNTTFLDGKRVTMGELRHHCDAIPFMAQRRMVLVQGLLGRLASTAAAGRGGAPESSPDDESQSDQPAWKRAFVQELLDYLPGLPNPTRLVFVEQESLKGSHPVVKFALNQGEGAGAYVREFKAPKDGELPGWIRERARAKGGRFNREAIQILATLVGGDLRLLDQEIEKLAVYADGQPVTGDDVKALVSRAREASIFDLVDCLGRGQAARAQQLLLQLLADGAEPLYVLAMLARQVRILIQVSELRAQGRTERQMLKRLGLHRFVLQKAMAQSRLFDMEQLEAAHERLVATDRAIKTGELPDELAISLLVVDLTRR